MPPPGRPSSAVPGAATRDTRVRILAACRELLERERNVRLSDIARRAGITRQGLYLHFPSRVELLVATTRYVDEVNDVDARLARSRSAPDGVARLDAFVAAWGGYIPEIYGVARALLSMRETDAAAAEAWDDRMRAVREGCAAAVAALDADGVLAPGLGVERATDTLAMLLSIRNWEQLVREGDWSQDDYVAGIGRLARRALLAP